MNLMEYVKQLMNNGTWSRLSGDAHSILIYIIAKSNNKAVKLSFSGIAKDLDISVNTTKKHIKVLIAENLILYDKEMSTYKLTVEIINDGSGLPMPPSIPGSDNETELTDLFQWAKAFMDSTWGKLIGGAIIAYIIRLWIDYIETSNSSNDPYDDWLSFYKESPYKSLRLDDTIQWLNKI